MMVTTNSARIKDLSSESKTQELLKKFDANNDGKLTELEVDQDHDGKLDCKDFMADWSESNFASVESALLSKSLISTRSDFQCVGRASALAAIDSHHVDIPTGQVSSDFDGEALLAQVNDILNGTSEKLASRGISVEPQDLGRLLAALSRVSSGVLGGNVLGGAAALNGVNPSANPMADGIRRLLEQMDVPTTPHHDGGGELDRLLDKIRGNGKPIPHAFDLFGALGNHDYGDTIPHNTKPFPTDDLEVDAIIRQILLQNQDGKIDPEVLDILRDSMKAIYQFQGSINKKTAPFE